MNEEQTIETCKRVIEECGEVHQATKAVEELSELSQALCKWLNVPDGDPREPELEARVREEIADVQIMVYQLEEIFGVSQVYANLRDKMAALAARLERGEL